MSNPKIFPRLTYPVCLVLFITACSSSRPVLYPNSYRQSVSIETVNYDINDCIRLANASGAAQKRSGKIATNAAGSAAVGGAAGAAAGAVRGNTGRGAATGAAAAGAASVMRGALQSDDPDPLHKAFVNKCLRDRGYEPIGWE